MASVVLNIQNEIHLPNSALSMQSKYPGNWHLAVAVMYMFAPKTVVVGDRLGYMSLH